MKVELNKIYRGDCLNVMAQWPENFVDTIITDPPYGLAFMGKDWDQSVPGPRFWQEMLRIAKPGALLLTFGGTRTYHRMACAVEDAGWQVRDCLMWLYGSGFPKSLDISKALDKRAGAEREVIGYKRQGPRSMFDGGKPRPATLPATLWDGYGTALKPAWEPILLAMKPLDGTFAENAERWGVAGLNVDGGRIGIEGGTQKTNFAKRESVSAYGDGLNGGGCESINAGRWPANLLLDEEAAGMLDGQTGDRKAGGVVNGAEPSRTGQNGIYGDWERVANKPFADSGGASRFFYVAKADRSERNEGCEELPKKFNGTMGNGIGEREHDPSDPRSQTGNHHPTVKPLDLMKYLCNLTRTPTGGIVLDPFSGSGSTLWAAEFHNRPWLGIEMNPEYAVIAEARLVRERSQMKMDL